MGRGMSRTGETGLYHQYDFQRACEEYPVDGALAPETYRSGFRRDYARLIHSTSFRRLKGKMQLFPDSEGDYFRNRLTHSLEVAQVAKSIAIKLNSESPLFQQQPIDLDLIEFCALAHDLGHPPFGHEGETALNECMAPYGGFEGNAQTLRLLAVVEKKISSNTDGPLIDQTHDYRAGLNLNYRSLAAILKYDKRIPERFEADSGVRKGYYASEQTLVDDIKRNVTHGRVAPSEFKTIECQIMDIADDIAYSTYDLDDALKSGLIRILDISTLAFELGAVRKTEKNLGEQAYDRNRLTSHLVGEFIRAVGVKSPDGISPVFTEIHLDKAVWIKIETLKHLTFHFLIHSPRWKVVAWRSREIVKYLFKTLTEKNGHELMPEDCKQLYDLCTSETGRMRVVCDFIACMTDTYAVEFYSRLQSDRPSSFFKPL